MKIIELYQKVFQNRNRIKGPNGEIILSIPVKKSPQNTCIRDIEISYDGNNALHKHWQSIQHSYRKAPYFEKYSDSIAVVY